MSRQLTVLGVNHRTAPIDVRERLSRSVELTDDLLESIVALPTVHEAVVLSTCNRVEVVACAEQRLGAGELLASALFRDSGLESDRYKQYLYDHSDREAVRHVFRVASSLDSMIVGEPQILGQMKAQFDRSVEIASAGPVLHRVFDKSFSVAKKVRSETGVAARTVSVASTAVDLAGRIFETLKDRTVMLIGTGEIGEAAARHLKRAGAGKLLVVNRTYEAAVALARDLDGIPVPMERLYDYLPLADLVVGSAGGGQILDADSVRTAMRERRNAPVFFIDLAVPRNFAADVNEVEEAFLYDIDDLAGVVEENLEERQREALHAEAIVEEEVDRFWRWFEKLAVEPTVADLRARAELIRTQELARTLGKLSGLTQDDRERVEQFSRSLVNKLLHDPTLVLKQDQTPHEEAQLLSSVRRLFRLDRKE